MLNMSQNSESLVVAAGCFWCVEAMFRMINGVNSVISGYCGGTASDANYKAVCSGQTGHAEAVKIIFDSEIVSRGDLLRMFFVAHDPTTLNRQGGDVGTQYRSSMFFGNSEEKELMQKVRDEIGMQGLYEAPIVTTLEPLGEFFEAEETHQGYFERFEQSSMWDRLNFNTSYCQNVVEPKVAKFRKQFLDKLRHPVGSSD